MMSTPRTLDFSRKHVLVVGGSSGIGNAIARGFRDAGARVTATGTRERTAYRTDLSDIVYRRLELPDPVQIRALADGIDTLDVLVYSAAAVFYKGREFEPTTFRSVLDVNLSAAMELFVYLQPKLTTPGGSIIAVSSVVGGFGTRGNPAYGASKAAVSQLVKTLAVAWAKNGIRVNALAPGFVETKMTAVSRQDAAISDGIVARTPMRRWGREDDMVGPTLFLASEHAAFITGQTLIVDGGYSLVF